MKQPPAQKDLVRLFIDCLDCGRQIAHRGRCGKCGGSSWLPAGYINRQAVKILIDSLSTEA